jgi:alanine dehydrogenase
VKIGIAAENRPSEKRVIMRPEELRDIASSHEVIVEKGAGIGVGFPDSEFEGAGCKIGSRKEVYACGLILKIKELKEDELKLTKPGSILMSMMHLRCAEELENSLKRQKLIAIPLENIKDQFGKRKVEAVEDSGRIGMEYGFKLWGKDPAKAQVKIMGYGNIAVGAIRCAARKLARVEILNKKHFQEMEKHIPGTDILVDAVNRPYRREVKREKPFVTREMLKLFKKGSVIVDLVSNPVNHAPVETMKPTTLNDPSFVVDGIHHTSCWGWPGFEPETITRRYSIQLKPIVMEVADKGINGTNNLSEDIKKAVMDFRG